MDGGSITKIMYMGIAVIPFGNVMSTYHLLLPSEWNRHNAKNITLKSPVDPERQTARTNLAHSVLHGTRIQYEYMIIGVIVLIALNTQCRTTIIKFGGSECFKCINIIPDQHINVKRNRRVDKISRKRLFNTKTEQNRIIQKPLLVSTF